MKLPTIDEILEIIDFDPTKDLSNAELNCAISELKDEFSDLLNEAYNAYIERRNARQKSKKTIPKIDALVDAIADVCTTLYPEAEEDKDVLKDEIAEYFSIFMPFFKELADKGHVKSTEVDGNTTTVRECSINKNLQDIIKRVLEKGAFN